MEVIQHFVRNDDHDELYIMEVEGKAYSRMYWFHDDPQSVYLNNLSVENNEREQGFGTKMQELREKIGIELGATQFFLWVKRGSWMHKWYTRRGYNDFSDYTDDDSMIWMIKLLNNGQTIKENSQEA